MTMPLQPPKRLSIFTSTLLAGTLLASLACANNRAATNTTAPNTDATVMGEATPTGDDVSRAPASTSSKSTSTTTDSGAGTTTQTTTTTTQESTTETSRAPASAESAHDNDQASRKKHSKKKSKASTESTSGSSAAPGGGAADTSVPQSGSTNRDMSQAGPSSTEFSGTSFGVTSAQREPASVGGMSETTETTTTTTTQSSDQIPSDREAMRKSARNHQMESEEQAEARRPADGRTIVIVQQTPSTGTAAEPELSSRLNALGAPPVEISRGNNPAWKGNDAFDTEPYSRFPYHVGSVQVTGKDKSVAVLEGTNTFTDPNALARNEATRGAVVKNQDIDFNNYTFNRRGNFQSTMRSRLNNVGRTIDGLSADARLNTQMQRSSLDDVIADLQGRQAAVVQQVNNADNVSRDQWDSYKDSFRTELSQLERSVAQLSAALR